MSWFGELKLCQLGLSTVFITVLTFFAYDWRGALAKFVFDQPIFAKRNEYLLLMLFCYSDPQYQGQEVNVRLQNISACYAAFLVRWAKTDYISEIGTEDG